MKEEEERGMRKGKTLIAGHYICPRYLLPSAFSVFISSSWSLSSQARPFVFTLLVVSGSFSVHGVCWLTCPQSSSLRQYLTRAIKKRGRLLL
jgi:hypothetical protein